jgi:hypothetical protein
VLIAKKYYLDEVCIGLKFTDIVTARNISHLVEALGFELTKSSKPTIKAFLEIKSTKTEFIKPTYSNPIYTSGSISTYLENGHLFFTDGKSLFEVDLVRKSGNVLIHDTFWDKPFYAKASLLIMLLIKLLWQFDLHELHGAALVKDGKGLMIIGPSGSGKSTIALSLISNGWSFLTDDMILLYESENYIKALPLRRYFKIDQEVVKKYPELLKISKKPLGILGNKAFLNLHEVYDNQHSTHCIPKVLVFPYITNQEKSYFEPMKESEAFINLLTNNCYGMFLENKVIKNRVDTMNALLSQTDIYKLSVGLDLYNKPSMISEFLPNF